MKRVIAYPGMSADDRPMGPSPPSPCASSRRTPSVSGLAATDPETGLLAGVAVALR